MRKELENHHSECVGYLQNQIKLKDEMIKKQAQEWIFNQNELIRISDG